MKNKERIIWVGLTLLLVVGASVFYVREVKCNRRLSGVRKREAILNREIEGLSQSWRRLGARETERLRRRRRRDRIVPFEAYLDVEDLRQKGLENPARDIAADLVKHPELIPYDGVAGGSMGFFSQGDIHVLSPMWVMAHFDDGHVQGCMILEYEVSDQGEIAWKVVASYLD